MKSKTKNLKFRPPQKVEYIVFDFDGVFTDNKVYTSQNGAEMIICDRRDGLGINMLKELNIPMVILSTEHNPVVAVRAKKMGLNAETGCRDKEAFLKVFFSQKGISSSNVIYMGNDLNDLAAMKMVGYSICPSDAHWRIKGAASYVLGSKGGDGAVREMAEKLLTYYKER